MANMANMANMPMPPSNLQKAVLRSSQTIQNITRQAAIDDAWHTELLNEQAFLAQIGAGQQWWHSAPGYPFSTVPSMSDSLVYDPTLTLLGSYAQDKITAADKTYLENEMEDREDPNYYDFDYKGAPEESYRFPSDSPRHIVYSILADDPPRGSTIRRRRSRGGRIGSRRINLTGLPWFIEEKTSLSGATIWYDSLADEYITNRNMVPRQTITNMYDTEQLWAPIHEIFGLMKMLPRMLRFTDGRNPELQARVLPDGSNIPLQEPALITSWALHRSWIRLLHYKSLFVGDYPIGGRHLKEIETLSLAFYMLELRDVDRRQTQNRVDVPAFRKVREMYDTLKEWINILGEFIMTETRAVGQLGPNHQTEATYRYNLHPDRLRPFMEGVLLPFMNDIDDWKIWARLLKKADEFNAASDALHVEDVLVSKRVVLTDEWYDIHDKLLVNLNMTQIFNNPPPALDAAEDEIYGTLKGVSQINRLRRNKLLMTHWSGSRPWRQLYIMYDTSETGEPDLEFPIRTFGVQIRRIDMFYPFLVPQNPSNKANIWRNLFLIHPLASTDLPDETDITTLGPYYFPGKCLICYDDFTETTGTVMVRLLCDHWYHFVCIREHWDQDDLVMLPCPVCRTGNVDWQLHNHAGITPEVRGLDVWDHEEVTDYQHVFGGPPDANGHPDPRPNRNLGSRHSTGMESQLMNMSRTWDPINGYGAPINGSTSRIPRIEMASIREMRRQRNRTRTAAARTARMGYYGLDPVAAPAL